MKIFIFLAISLVFISCDSNPLGKTSLSSCEHSPGVQTGLPLTCQVNLAYKGNLALWLDIHDNGTLTLENQSLVDSIGDKSGSGFSFDFDAGSTSKASINKKSSNDRNAMKFNLNQGRYENTAITGFGADQSFSMAISLKTSDGSAQALNINNGVAGEFEFGFSNDLITRVSLVGGSSTAPIGLIEPNSIHKVLLIYDSSSKLFRILDSSGDTLHSVTISGSSAAWANLFIEGAGEIELNEFIVYREALSDINALQVLSYLNNKWGF